MNTLIDNYRNSSSSWVASVRERFSCDNNETHLKIWELWTLILCSFSKEILDFLVYTIYPSIKGGWVRLFSSTFPLNLDIFWILLLKLGMGYVFLLYLNIKHKGTKTLWRVWVFWFLTIFFPFINSLNSKYDIIKGISGMLSIIIYVLFFIYFFVVDPVHIDSWRMLLYDNLTVDEATGRVYKNANSKISGAKMKHLAFTTIVVIVSAMFLIFIVSQILNLFKTRSAKGSEPIKPKNQEKLEKLSKDHPIILLISSVIIAPILEEWLYRRFILKEGKFKWWTILLSGFIFGLIHLSDGEGVLYIIPYILPGIVFATTMYISKNIWHSIIAHALFNTIVLIRVFST